MVNGKPSDIKDSYHYLGTRWRSWLRHCATSRKVADPIPDGVTGMAVASTHPLTEMSTSVA